MIVMPSNTVTGTTPFLQVKGRVPTAYKEILATVRPL